MGRGKMCDWKSVHHAILVSLSTLRTKCRNVKWDPKSLTVHVFQHTFNIFRGQLQYVFICSFWTWVGKFDNTKHYNEVLSFVPSSWLYINFFIQIHRLPHKPWNLYHLMKGPRQRVNRLHNKCFFFFFKQQTRCHMLLKKPQQRGLDFTWAPWYLWHCQMGKCVGCSWNLRHTDFHRCPMPEPPAPTACCLGPVHYSWGTRCFCVARSPWQWRSQGAGERWTGSPHCLCKECLENKTACVYECMIGVCHW